METIIFITIDKEVIVMLHQNEKIIKKIALMNAKKNVKSIIKYRAY